LRKADLGIQIADSEFKWLAENHLFETIYAIRLQQYGTDDVKRLGSHLAPGKLNVYSVTKCKRTNSFKVE
jgi:hypothetical protein